jgi:hypothetical protein
VDADVETDPEAPKPCTARGHECGAMGYCEATKCGGGFCTPKPTSPSLALAEVCGCDGITYWNADQAGVQGVSIDVSGECGAAPPPEFTGSCGAFFGHGCPAGTACVLDEAECPMGDAGADAGTYRDCDASTCISDCEAVKSGVLVRGC